MTQFYQRRFAKAIRMDGVSFVSFFDFLSVNSIEKIASVGLKHFASIPLAITMLFVSTSLCAQTLVEFSMDEAPLEDGVGTCVYGPTEVEKPFFLRLSEERQSTIETMPGEFGDAAEHFALAGHRGQFVSWFGIVRHIFKMGWPHRGRLLIQNTYFTGLTDCHTQTVEINGGGDFEAKLSALPDDIIPLVLVRVYGVVRGENEGRPVIEADYVRVWHFFQFNFMDYGVDHSNPEWRSRIKLPEDERIYHIGVSRKYYEERLGPTSEESREIQEYHGRQTELEFERERFEPMNPSGKYKPREWEQDYFDDFPENERVSVQTKPGELPASTFELAGHVGRRVTWFGIVREVTPDGIGKRGGKLLIENKYFKGSGDEKLQTISIRGRGDFVAEVSNLSEELAPLLLVRIYGRVLREENGVPVVKVKFLRGWHVSQYNFDEYGEDHSDPRWTKRLHLKPGESIHQDKVSPEYYIDRLGPTDAQTEKIREQFKWKNEREKEKKDREGSR
ncbi:MAG: hypothetical protein QOH01_320 [Verrucomicrobiota bacterium]|jgi:hypothetical protein